ncbi:MAG: M4 family metallopeptidase [Methanosarcina sp.]
MWGNENTSRLTENQEKTVESLKSLDPESEFFWDEKNKIPKFVKGKLSTPSHENPELIARRFLAETRGLLDMPGELDEQLEVSALETDNKGFHHVSFYQILNGLPVFEGSVQVHINSRGEVVAYKDYRVTDIGISLEPEIKEQSAVEIALKDIGTKVNVEKTEAKLLLYRDQKKQLHLAWEVELLVAGELGARYYFIDAHTGQLLYKFAQIRNLLFRKTYTAHNEAVLPGELLLEDEQTTSDEVALSAHEKVALAYEYYRDLFGRDSFDGEGAKLVSTVHFRQNYNNASWSDYYKQLIFGDGDGFRWKPLAFVLDIVAHEFTHAVSSHTARFVYSEEAGALDESFADVFAVLISNGDPIMDWEIGEGVYTPNYTGDALRDLSTPSKYGQPDHMDNFIHLDPGELPDPDKNDNGYLHYNSGIPNKVAHLIIEGGTHYGIPVEGISRQKAEQIYYLALSAYLNSSTPSRWTFEQARYALLNACRQLYGDQGSEYASIKNAWASVGIGQPTGNLLIIEKEIIQNMRIPDSDPEGIKSSINVPEAGLVKDIRVYVNITHPRSRELRVTLISPAGEHIVLHDRNPGSGKNIVTTYNSGSIPKLRACIGDQIQGDWILNVSDLAKDDTGSLSQWGLKFLVEKAEKKQITQETIPGIQVPDDDVRGIESQINIEKSGKIVNLDVSVNITHSWIGDLVLILVLPSGDEVILHNRKGYSRKEIKNTYSTRSDENLQALVNKEIMGVWKLKVLDLAKNDIGILNSWRIDIVYDCFKIAK